MPVQKVIRFSDSLCWQFEFIEQFLGALNVHSGFPLRCTRFNQRNTSRMIGASQQGKITLPLHFSDLSNKKMQKNHKHFKSFLRWTH